MIDARLYVDKEKLYNFNQLKEIYPDNDGFLKHFAGIFLKITPSDCSEMLSTMEAGDWQMVSKYAHKIKSTIDSMNMTSIKTDIRTIELDAKSKTNIANLRRLGLKVEKVISEVALQVKDDFNL